MPFVRPGLVESERSASGTRIAFGDAAYDHPGRDWVLRYWMLLAKSTPLSARLFKYRVCKLRWAGSLVCPRW